MCHWAAAKAITSTVHCSMKSTKVAPIAESGRISRGNHTFFTSAALPTTEPTAAEVPFWKRLKMNTPDIRNSTKSGIELGRMTLKIT